ncbi:hypothetical protein [Acetoanaerobium noterae]|uniref:hypothetical protein n=1 Tax=Acetoanaerobium noterae TaxID=745369 RepID=UPI0032221668
MQISLPNPLELENTEEILSFTAGPAKLALWPLVRSAVLARLTVFLRLREEGTNSCKFDAPVPTDHSRKQGVAKNLKLALSWPADRDILYVSNKPVRLEHKGRPYNQWEQPTAELLGSRTLFVTTNGTRHYFDDKSGIEFRDISPFYRYAYRLQRILPKSMVSRISESFCDFLTNRLDSIFGSGTHRPVLSGIIEKIIPRLYVQTLEYFASKYTLSKSATKIVFISTGSYGNNIGIQSAATDIGIHTVELQHGEISPSHYAYNCAKPVIDHPHISRYMPHYFLSYGPFWHDRIASPSKLVPMGNPFFTMAAQTAAQCMGRGILFALSDEYESFTPYISAAIRAFPDREVIVRPHPHCREAFAASSIAKLEGYTLDTAATIYSTFARAETVISTGSTTLFEAAASGRTCLLKPSSITTDGAWKIFSTIDDPDEMIGKISSPDQCRLPLHVRNSIFSGSWRENYVNFINHALA